MTNITIKLCGLTTIEAVKASHHPHVHYNGFIAYSPSPRHLDSAQMEKCRRYVASHAKAVLVTVNATDDLLDQYVEAVKPDILQLHGNESIDRCNAIKQRYKLPLIKAIGIKTQNDLAELSFYKDTSDVLLLDTARADGTSGGTGQSFNWSWLDEAPLPPRTFLSGGINTSNLDKALNYSSFIDVSSSLETQKGIKDITKMSAFLKKLDALVKTR